MTILLSQTAREITRSAFVGKDFTTYRQELIDALNDIFGPEIASNIVASEQGVMLIELVAYALSSLSWQVDRQADETNFDNPGGVRIRTNAVAIARILGYVPFAAVPPVVEATMVIDPPFDTGSGGLPSRLTLEKGRKLVSTTGVEFELAEEVIFEIGEGGPKTLLVRQGRSFSETFVSTGEPDQRFQLQNFPDNLTIAEDTLEARVGGVLWASVDLLTFDQLNVTELNIGQDPPFIRFGDGAAGNIPPIGAEIRVTGFVTLGPAGTVTSNTVTQFVEGLVAGTTDVTATLTHAAPSTPGSFRQSISSIKVNAPLVFQTAQRAVTIKDLDGLINSFVDATWGAVAKGRATTPRSAAGDAKLQSHLALIRASADIPAAAADELERYWDKVLSSNCQANVVMAQILAADLIGRYIVAPVGLARALETYLDGLVESTVKVYVVDGFVNVRSVDLLCEIAVDPLVASEVVNADIRATATAALEEVLLDRDYGVSLQIGDLYQLIEAIPNVLYTNIRITNQPGLLDTFGNLPIADYEVITLGAVPTVTVIE